MNCDYAKLDSQSGISESTETNLINIDVHWLRAPGEYLLAGQIMSISLIPTYV